MEVHVTEENIFLEKIKDERTICVETPNAASTLLRNTSGRIGQPGEDILHTQLQRMLLTHPPSRSECGPLTSGCQIV